MNLLVLIKSYRKNLSAYFLTWLLLIMSVSLCSLWCELKFNPGSYKAVMMAQAGSTIMMGYLFNPVREYASHRLYVCLWSFCLALAFIITTFLSSDATGFSIAFYMQVAVAVFLLSFCLLSLSRVVHIGCSNQPSVSWVIFCLLLILTTLPVWFAPWVEVIATTPDKLNLIISMTPLSYLATVLDFDYLRSQWFYQHTPYGMLRYDYPKLINMHTVLSSIALLLLAIKDKQTDLIINENHLNTGEGR